MGGRNFLAAIVLNSLQVLLAFSFSRNTHTMAPKLPKGEFMGRNLEGAHYWTTINYFINFIIRQFSRPIRLLFNAFGKQFKHLK
jgi:hypothetical protein